MPRRIQPTLHEAIKMILARRQNQTASLSEICRQNRLRDLYRRPCDGDYPQERQILLRVSHRRYRRFFRLLINDRIQLR